MLKFCLEVVHTVCLLTPALSRRHVLSQHVSGISFGQRRKSEYLIDPIQALTATDDRGQHRRIERARFFVFINQLQLFLSITLRMSVTEHCQTKATQNIK